MQSGRSFGTFSLMLALAACSIVSSHETDLSQSAKRSGVLYMLPKAIVQIQVTDTAGSLAATLFNPILVGDDQASYLLSYDASILSADQVKVEVDPKTSLLQLIDATAEDKTADIIKKLAQTAALIAQSGEAGGETVLYNKTFDPATDQETVTREVNEAIQAYLTEKSQDCAGTSSDNACLRYKTLNDKILSANAEPLFRLTSTPPLLQAGTVSQAKAPPTTDCTIGICYRPVLPYQITAKLDYRLSSVTVFLPNKAPAIALPLDRFLMVTAVHKITLRDGLLASVETNKPSQALAVASLPLDVAEAVISSLTNFAKLGAGLERERTNLLKAQLDAQKQAVENKNFRPQSGVLGGSGSIMLQVTTGSVSITPHSTNGSQSDRVSPGPQDGTTTGSNRGTGASGTTTPPSSGSGSGG